MLAITSLATRTVPNDGALVVRVRSVASIAMRSYRRSTGLGGASTEGAWVGSDSLQVGAAARIYLDAVALVDKHRDLDRGAGLEGGGLGSAGNGVALVARVGLGDLQLDRDRQL